MLTPSDTDNVPFHHLAVNCPGEIQLITIPCPPPPSLSHDTSSYVIPVVGVGVMLAWPALG